MFKGSYHVLRPLLGFSFFFECCLRENDREVGIRVGLRLVKGFPILCFKVLKASLKGSYPLFRGLVKVV